MNHLQQDDLNLFALQLLPESEMQALALHLKDCPLCRAEVADIQGGLLAYALTAEMKAPPASARERLMAQVAKEKKIVAIDRPAPQVEPVLASRSSRVFQMESPESDPRRGMGAMGWVGWAVAAGVAVVAGLQYQQRQAVQHDLSVASAQLSQKDQASARADQVLQTLNDATAMQVSLHVPRNPGVPAKVDPEGHAVYSRAKGSLIFVASHLDPLQPSKTYELWLLPAEAGVAPIPAGLFRPDARGNASVTMPKLPAGMEAKGFGVTVEEDGGSQKPTAPIVLAGF